MKGKNFRDESKRKLGSRETTRKLRDIRKAKFVALDVEDMKQTSDKHRRSIETIFSLNFPSMFEMTHDVMQDS